MGGRVAAKMGKKLEWIGVAPQVRRSANQEFPWEKDRATLCLPKYLPR